MATLTSPLSPTAPSAERPTTHRRLRYKDNVYLQDGNVVIGILSALVFLIVAVSLDAAGYVDDLTVLLPVTMGAIILGLLMSFSRFDAFFALSLSLFTGLAWILYQMTPLVSESQISNILERGVSPLQAKSYVVLVSWMDWITDAVTGQANEDNFVFIFELSFLMWWLAFLGIWAIFRYGYTWRAVIPAGVVLVLNTYYARESVLGFLVIFSLVGLVLLIRTNLSEQQLRWREQRTYFSPDISLDFMRNAFIYSIMVLAIAWIVPGLGRSSTLRAMLDPVVNEPMEDAMVRVKGLYEGLAPWQVAGTATFGRSLTLGGARNAGDNPIFQVQSEGGRYWRAVAYDTYTGTGWQNTAEEKLGYGPNEEVQAEDWLLRQPVTYTVELLSSTGGVIFAPPDILQLDVPIRSTVQTLGNVQEGAGTDELLPHEVVYAISTEATAAGNTYTVVSNYASVTERALNEANIVYPSWITERYLQLPEDFSPQVQILAAELTADHETAYQQAKAVERFLREIPYNEQIEAPPAGVDPVEYFLFDIQEGYCDYYASSMVTMLRSQGIPSRAVSGYAEGTREEGITSITEQDAHTWVEVYFPEYGWIEFEPTAQESTLDRPSGEALAESGPIPGQPDESSDPSLNDPSMMDEEYNPGLENLQDMDLPFPDMSQANNSISWWVWAIVLPMVLLLGGLLVRRVWFVGPSDFSPDLPPILYERMQNWARRLGLNLSPIQTPYEQAGQLKRVFPDGSTYIDDITNSYVHYSFSNENRSLAQRSLSTTSSATERVTSVADTWQPLRRLFLKAWLKKLLHFRRKQDPYSLSG